MNHADRQRVGALAASLLSFTLLAAAPAAEPTSSAKLSGRGTLSEFVSTHCLDCHSAEDRKGGLALDGVLTGDIGVEAKTWEAVIRKLNGRQMPPADAPRPSEESYREVVAWLEAELDRAAEKKPDPGRTETFRRLNRTEYRNAIRDLLALDIDAAALLPPDESSHGFDNITVADLSPTLLNRYISAAQKISRLAVGMAGKAPGGETFRMRPDVTQDAHVEGLPLGTRGGMVISHHFPQDGEYEVQVRLMRDRNDDIESLRGKHELEVLLDRERQALFPIAPVRDGDDRSVDANLNVRLRVKAGPHEVGVTFLKQPSSLLETQRQPLNVHYNFYRHPRLGPAVYQVSILGPFDATGPGETPSRNRIFTSRPTGPDDEEACASRILSGLMRRAYRRPVGDEDLNGPLEFFREGRAAGGFEAGIEKALSAVLVSPQFLFRIERDPAGLPSGKVYRISDLELASRLSFFLWSSIPDDALLDAAERGDLSRPEVLDEQVRRMLADERSQSLVSSFADQWLYLRNLEAVIPDGRLFPDFDDNLRQAFRRETELLFESVLREDRSVLDLLTPGYTHLNERLARHYGIPHVQGSRFRRVDLDEDSERGGILRHGSILSVTSYATRTSPVLRGKWILENILGTPPPPPPPNVPALEDNTVSAGLPVRARLAEHRNHAACASCHDLIDPVGFSLDHFDAVGRWRELADGLPVDDGGGLPDGRTFDGVEGLEEALRDRPELFVRTLTEKLLTFALGRGLEYTDAPAIRGVVRAAQGDDYRFSALILGIVHSPSFQMRKTP
jgi:mono/diheme cytochrome c family protein